MNRNFPRPTYEISYALPAREIPLRQTSTFVKFLVTASLFVNGLLFWQLAAQGPKKAALPPPRDDSTLQALSLKVGEIERILPGIVRSVEMISSRNLGESPQSVEVLSDGAYLRATPSIDAPSLGRLKKGTTLYSLEKKNEWLKVTSPKGEQAFIHESLVGPR